MKYCNQTSLLRKGISSEVSSDLEQLRGREQKTYLLESPGGESMKSGFMIFTGSEEECINFHQKLSESITSEVPHNMEQ